MARFVRALASEVERQLARKTPALIQALVGARQTGKTTIAEEIARRWRGPVVSASADQPLPPGPEWVATHWLRARRAAGGGSVLLVLDEIQKVRGWSEMVKALWDEDRRGRREIRPLLLGSSALSIARGLSESLAGRFFLHRCSHWSFAECAKAFGWSLDEWLYFGGYPGAAALAQDEADWRSYVADSLIETAIARDVLALERVAKPALLRHLFALAAQYPAEILSYNKMLGSLQDAGNTVTLAHYLELLEAAFMVSGLSRASSAVKTRGSSPKLVLWNNALITALSGLSFEEARDQPDYWGRLVENAVGAHLVNHLPPPRYRVEYWRERNHEIDFVVNVGKTRIGIEVKSGRAGRPTGAREFQRRFPRARVILIGQSGMPLEEALRLDPSEWLA